MTKRTAAAWIGITLVVAAGMSLLRQTQAVVAAKPGIVATDRIERESGKGRQQIVAGEVKQVREVVRMQVRVDEHIRRTFLRSISATTLPSPPLPSRVLPGPPPTSEQVAPERKVELSPMPPVSSKTPPEAIPDGAQSNSTALDETESIDPS
jgi:hypothetical protein